ncbi:MAG: Gfo/Idh/MocA family oxidoreductase [Cyclobacteriaceae bacterium]|nr:Gfo/Idh/MocA family oxidoreductase [Cyclobacteriaceae bacterium]MDH5248211.1 Gfo/Idh/MocA family oxidoreductase [Cyclobacteriaceae bacterium]
MNENQKQSLVSRRKFMEKAAAISAFSIVPRFVLGGKGYLTPSDKINLGFIGTGKQSIGLMRNFISTGEVQLVGACDVYQSKLDIFIDQIKKFYTEKDLKGEGVCKPYSDFRGLLDNKDVDAVVIVSPDHWHAVMAVNAANAGKDIYCEKPLSLTVKEGRAMVNAARKNKRIFQTGSMQRSWPEFRQTAELIRNGYIGGIKEVKVSVDGPPEPYNLPAEPVPAGLDWTSWLGPNEYKPFNNDIAPMPSDTFWARWRYYKEFGGGGMTDWGAHMFDIVQWALDMDNSGPVEVNYPDGQEFTFLTYKYADGLPMTHENFGKNNAIRFIGTSGQIDVRRRNLETTPTELKDQVIGPNEKHVYFSENHYKDFLQAIRKRSMPICDVEIGHRTATVCNIGNIAYELKRSLKWDPKTEKFVNDKEANALLSRPLKKEWSIRL